MRLSSKTRIGVQALYDMAFHCRGRQAQAKEIARRQQIPVRTLEEVLQELRRAGLVDAQRGPRGGYTLARLPQEISLSQIVRALDGPVEHLFALRDDKPAPTTRRRGRPAAPRPPRGEASSAGRGPSSNVPGVPEMVWGDVVDQIAAVLGQATLGDFIARAERSGVLRDSGEAPRTMYVI